MATKRRRFSKLARDLRVAGTGATDPRVKGYLNFVTQPPGSILKVDDTATANVKNDGGLIQKSVGIYPFNTYVAAGLTDADRKDARMSAAAVSRFKANGLDKDYFGIKAVTADVFAGYQPAKAHLFASDGSTSPATSQITLAKYTRKVGKGFSVPFGRTDKGINDSGAKVASVEFCDEQEAKAGIIEYIATKPTISVSFASEFISSVGTAKALADLV